MMTWIVSADMAVGEFVAFQAGYRSAAKTTSGETVKFVQVVWRPLVANMATAMTVISVLEHVDATPDSEGNPANCVSLGSMALTAQPVPAGTREGAMMALEDLDSVSASRAGRAIAARTK